MAPADVVLDDILVLRAGDQVPADAVVADGRALQIDESMLTGESDPVDKNPGDDALSGSVVVAGEGDAQVTRVGADSYANKFAGEAKRFSLVSSELRSSIDRVLTWVGWGIGPIGLLVLNAQMMVAGGWVQAWESGTWVQAVVNTIASLTAMIPLGLVLVTSIAFAVGAAKLASRQVLVNELPAVEGLARVDVICLDKTGTLTGGDIVFDGSHPLTGAAAGWERTLAWYGAAPDANATARCLREPFPVGGGGPRRRVHPVLLGPQVERGLLRFAGRAARGCSVRRRWCSGMPRPTPPANSAAPSSISLRSGRRTLVLAHSAAVLSEADVEAERLPAGVAPAIVLTFREQVRPDAAHTLAYFKTQGVGIRIISGDNPRTVAAIAREVGLDVAEGYDARKLPDDDAALREILETPKRCSAW